jgi:hypothetical protein
VTRFAWVRAGNASASDARIPLELPEQTSNSQGEATNR